MVRLAIRDSAHHFISRSSQGAGLCCECVFLHLIKEPGFVTHRILRSKSNTYYMNTTAGYFPTSPDIFVYKQQKKKKKEEIQEPTERSNVVWFVMLLDERRVCLSDGFTYSFVFHFISLFFFLSFLFFCYYS